MELRQIEYFVCLYEVGSVTRAAERINIVQPALSMQIAKPEKGKTMQPTEAGELAFQLFFPVLESVNEAREMVINYRQPGSQHLPVE